MIQVKEEFKNLIPPLNDSEFKELEDSILAEGCRESLIVWNNILVDGHHRYEICTKHNIPFKVINKDFEDENEAMLWIINNQLGRRNITDFARAELVLKKKDILLEKGREKQKQTLGGYKYNEPSVLSKLDKTDKKQYNTREILAKEIGVGQGTIGRVEVILKEAPEEVKEKLRCGVDDLTINKVYNEIKIKKRKEEIENIKNEIKNNNFRPPNEKFDVIVIDPPWPYNNEDNYDPEYFRGTIPYPSMSIEEIKSLEIPASDDCVLWLWTTHRFLRESFNILDYWGFRDVSILTWVKNKIGVGRWLRSQTEYCIMSVKGKPKVNLTSQSTVLYGKSREHSRKPDEFYTMVDSLCIGYKLDYFSREKREGWNQFGIEKDKFK